MANKIGKAVSPKETIKTFLQYLKKHNINIVISKAYNPLDNIYSVHASLARFETVYSNGKGTTEDAALASALGEFIERYSQGFFIDESYLGIEDGVAYCRKEKHLSEIDLCLTPKLLDFYFEDYEDLSKEDLIDFSSGVDEIVSIPFVKLHSKEEVLFPVNLLNNLYRSNGMACGNTINEAKVQALSEILERFVKFKVLREGLSLPDIPGQVLSEFEGISDSVKVIENNGYQVLIKDASLGGKYPVVNITLFHKNSGRFFANFGAHPNMEIAVNRTLTEIFQGRKGFNFNDLCTPSWDEYDFGSFENLESHFIDGVGSISWDYFIKEPQFNYWNWSYKNSIDEELIRLQKLITSEGYDIYEFEYAPLGVPTVRVIVPGLSEVYTVDDMIEENCNKGGKFYGPITKINSLSNEKLYELVELFEDENIDNFKYVYELIGLVKNEAQDFFKLKVIDLKLLIAIKTNDAEILSNLSPLIGHGEFEFKTIFDAVVIILRNSDFELKSLFDQSLVNKAMGQINDPFKYFSEDFLSLQREFISSFSAMRLAN